MARQVAVSSLLAQERAGGLPAHCKNKIKIHFLKYFLGGFFFNPTLLHLPLLRFHCANGYWDRTQDGCN